MRCVSGTMDSVASRLVAVGNNAFQQEETKVLVILIKTDASDIICPEISAHMHTSNSVKYEIIRKFK